MMTCYSHMFAYICSHIYKLHTLNTELLNYNYYKYSKKYIISSDEYRDPIFLGRGLSK